MGLSKRRIPPRWPDKNLPPTRNPPHAKAAKDAKERDILPLGEPPSISPQPQHRGGASRDGGSPTRFRAPAAPRAQTSSPLPCLQSHLASVRAHLAPLKAAAHGCKNILPRFKGILHPFGGLSHRCKAYLHSCKGISHSCKSLLRGCKGILRRFKRHFHACKGPLHRCKGILHAFKIRVPSHLRRFAPKLPNTAPVGTPVESGAPAALRSPFQHFRIFAFSSFLKTVRLRLFLLDLCAALLPYQPRHE